MAEPTNDETMSPCAKLNTSVCVAALLACSPFSTPQHRNNPRAEAHYLNIEKKDVCLSVVGAICISLNLDLPAEELEKRVIISSFDMKWLSRVRPYLNDSPDLMRPKAQY